MYLRNSRLLLRILTRWDWNVITNTRWDWNIITGCVYCKCISCWPPVNHSLFKALRLREKPQKWEIKTEKKGAIRTLVSPFSKKTPWRERSAHQRSNVGFYRRCGSLTENSEVFPIKFAHSRSSHNCADSKSTPALTAVALLAYGHWRKKALCLCQNMHTNKLQMTGFLLASL